METLLICSSGACACVYVLFILKGIVHSKMKCFAHLMLRSFEMCMTDFLLWNATGDILKSIQLVFVHILNSLTYQTSLMFQRGEKVIKVWNDMKVR